MYSTLYGFGRLLNNIQAVILWILVVGGIALAIFSSGAELQIMWLGVSLASFFGLLIIQLQRAVFDIADVSVKILDHIRQK